MISYSTFQRVSIKLTPQVSVFSFSMRTRIVQSRSVGISPCCHKYCVRFTSFFNLSVFGVADVSSARYASLRQFLKCSALRCMCTQALFQCKIWTSVSTSASLGVSLFILSGVTWVRTGLPGGIRYYLQYSALYSFVTFAMSTQEGLGALADAWQYQLLRMV